MVNLIIKIVSLIHEFNYMYVFELCTYVIHVGTCSISIDGWCVLAGYLELLVGNFQTKNSYSTSTLISVDLLLLMLVYI